MVSKPDCAVCYVTDMNYLAPTLASAAQLRSFVSAEHASIFCVLIDIDSHSIGDVRSAAHLLEIDFLHLNSAEITKFEIKNFRPAHVSISSLGRFFIEQILPSQFTRIVYLDGDTWFPESPIELIRVNIPEGRLAAADDAVFSQSVYETTPFGSFSRRYFKALNIKPKDGYFNGGVLAASRSTWRNISAEAFKYFCNNAEVCHHHDQSALNAVVKDRRLRLSYKWNFQTALLDLSLESRIEPRIYHFTEFPKPWMGDIITWRDVGEDVRKKTSLWAEKGLPFSHVSMNEIESYNSKKEKHRRRLKTTFFLRSIMRRSLINKRETDAWM
jgi:lipopolysaccharide biosynthesis glycosyltransferase